MRSLTTFEMTFPPPVISSVSEKSRRSWQEISHCARDDSGGRSRWQSRKGRQGQGKSSDRPRWNRRFVLSAQIHM